MRALVRATLRRLRPRRLRPAVLMYHRVQSLAIDPWALAVSPENFEAQLQFLRRHRRIVAMDVLVDLLRAGRLPDDAVAITFDDGYRDNLTHAAPLLDRYEAPAVLFLATGTCGSGRPFWWDELASLTVGCERAVRTRWRVAETELALAWPADRQARARSRMYRAWEAPVTERQRAYVAAWRALRGVAEPEREAALAELRAISGPVPSEETGLPLTHDEVRTLVRRGAYSLGAHGVSHAPMTTLCPERCAAELAASKRACEDLAAAPISGFAYPYGDLDPAVKRAVIGQSFAWACSTEAGAVTPRPDPFALRRIAVGDWDAQQLAGALQA